MSADFIQDLNEYFSKKYINFDLISTLPSYESVTISMVLKNKNRIEEGEIATNEVRKIFYQPKAEQVLAELKEKYVDNNFTFSVRVSPLRLRWKALFRARGLHGALIEKTISKYGEDAKALAPRLGLDEKLWADVLKSYYIPEKVLLFKLALLLGMRQDDFNALMQACGAYYNMEDARDVVVSYLIGYRVFNSEMIAAAFDEFRIRRIL